jgi:O-acetyl-ADP-ribose deacetylase (regulator of RNase III)
MIEYKKMDITTVERGVIAHGVNCQKKMGSGVAKAIRQKWPYVYSVYMEHDPILGTVDYVNVGSDLWVANCYTQERYGYDGQRYANPNSIRSCLESLACLSVYGEWPIYLPKIGCGLGGLNWEIDVEPLLREANDANPGCYLTVCEI